LQEAIKNTEENNLDNFQQIVSVFKEPTFSSTQQNKALLDSVIGKANRIINEKHDSKYVGQAFLLKGKAFYFQGDYFNANEFFDYVQKSAEDNPSIQKEALLWRIRSLIQLGNLSEATKVLEEVNTQNGETEGLKRFNGLSFATQANYYLNQNNKEEAIIHLSKAVEFSKNKKNRLHWQYLLGQLLFEKGENDLAYSHFSKIVRSNESYEKIFHANL
jgi:tetratricopeptide (TPR) repeat protein